MFEKRNQKVEVRFQRGKMFLKANVALDIRRLLLYTFIICLIVILLASLLGEDLRKYLIEVLIGIIQSVVTDRLNRK